MNQKLQIEAKTFWESVNKNVARAREIAGTFEKFAYANSREEPYDEEEDFLEIEFRRVIAILRGHLFLACDLLEAENFATNFKETWNHNNVTSISMLPWVGEFVCPALDDLLDALSTLQLVLPDRSEDFDRMGEIARVERILTGTPKMIFDRSLVPSNEAEVRKEVYGILLHLYPDTVREIPIPRVAKTYKPDLGVKSLKLAIEYKFIDSETELKQAIGGIYEDVHGYADSLDWQNFFAVLYMTEQFLTPAQIEAEFRSSGVPSNWRLIAVTGNGKRATKLKKSVPP